MRRHILALAVVGLAFGAPAARADVTPRYFTLPATIDAVSGGLAVGADGTVYFGGGNGFNVTPSIGRLNPSQAVAGTSAGITGVVTPAGNCCAVFFRDVSWSAKDNRLYWTRSDNLVGTMTAAGTLATAPLPASPWGIAAAPDGGAWLTEYTASNVAPAYAGNKIARVTAALVLSESKNLALQDGTGTLSSLRYDAKPKGIAVAADGSPWFAEADAGNPGYRIGHGVGSGYTEYLGPCFAAAPCSGSYTGEGITDVAMGADGSAWYVNNISRAVGHLVPGGAQTEFSLNTMSPGLGAGSPKAITAARDGSLWVAVFGSYSAPGANAIVHIVPGAPTTATVFKLGAANAPLEVQPDGADDVWFTGNAGAGGGPIGVLDHVTGTPTPTATPIPTATPDASATPTPGATPVPQPAASPVALPPAVVLTPTTVGTPRITDPTVSGDSVNANQICVGPPQDRCSLVYLLQTHEYVTGFPHTNGSAARAKALTTIGTLKVTLKGGQKQKVTIKLNAKGKKLRRKMAFKAILTVTQSSNGSKPKTVLKKNLKFKK